MTASRKPRRANSQGFIPTKNGQFNMRAPVIRKMPYLRREERMALVLSDTPLRSVAKKFGVDHTVVLRWRKCLNALSKERPSIWEEFRFSSSTGELANLFYKRGGNYLRLKFDLTKKAADGLLVALAIYGYLPVSREQYMINAVSSKVHQRSLANEERRKMVKSVIKEFGVEEITAKYVVGKAVPQMGEKSA